MNDTWAIGFNGPKGYTWVVEYPIRVRPMSIRFFFLTQLNAALRRHLISPLCDGFRCRFPSFFSSYLSVDFSFSLPPSFMVVQHTWRWIGDERRTWHERRTFSSTKCFKNFDVGSGGLRPWIRLRTSSAFSITLSRFFFVFSLL